MDNSQMHEFLGNFWNWMHLHWTYASMSDCCCSIDILITHGPPYGKLDKTDWGHCGSITLDERVKQIRPKFHIFGHIHEGYHEYGGTLVDGGPIVQYFNCSHVNEHYQPVNKPVRIIL